MATAVFEFARSTAALAPPPTAPTVYQYPEGWLEFVPLGAGRFRLQVRPRLDGAFLARDIVETTLPPSVVHEIARCEGFAWTAEAVARHENPAALEHRLSRHLFSYFSPTHFRSRRVLDFGCGTGASTLSLARLLPDSAIVGLDFDAARLALARAIAAQRAGTRAVSFVQSPSPATLPADIGMFDYVVFSEAFHHLLPAERRTLLPLLWKLLRPGGALIVHHSPHSWFPLESCASGLWMLNYLPDRTAGFLARWFSSIDEEANRERDWEDLLRAGLRGVSEPEILGLLPANAEVLQPVVQHSRALYWRDGVTTPGWSAAAIPVSAVLGWMDRRWGVVPTRYLDLVIAKHG